MTTELNDKQKDLLKWLVQETKNGNLEDEFQIIWWDLEEIYWDDDNKKGKISRQNYHGNSPPPDFTRTTLEFLIKEGFLSSTTPKYGTFPSLENALMGITNGPQVEISRRCELTGKAYQAVDSKFKSLPLSHTIQQNIGTLIQGDVVGKNINIQGKVSMGDVFKNISGSTIVNKSIVEKSFNKVKTDFDEDTAKALLRVAEEIAKSGNKEAAELFTGFNEELQKPEPKKSVLHSLWDGIITALPSLTQLADIGLKISKLFTS